MSTDLVLSAAMSSEPNEAPILLVDDEPQMLLSLSMTLETSGLSDVQTCEDGTRALELLSQRQHAAVLLDMLMPKISGMELLPRIVEQHPEVPVVMLTAVNELETAVECMKLGAFDYLVKPVDDARLVIGLDRYRDRITLKAAADLSDSLRIGGRKQQRLAFSRRMPDNLRHVFRKPHIEHSVCFVQNQCFQFPQLQTTSPQVIQQPAWSAHGDVSAMLQRTLLRPRGLAAGK